MGKVYKIICVNNKPIQGSTSFKTQSLTEGKVYETTDDISFRSVCVINDKGDEVNYSSSRFITLEEWRDAQLSKIVK